MDLSQTSETWDIFHHIYGYTFVHMHTFFNASRECIQFNPI